MNDANSSAARINPGEVRYIELGAGGAWEGASLDGVRLDWGIPENPHDLACAGDWAGAKQFYIEQGLVPATATTWVRELRDFHTLGKNDLERVWHALRQRDPLHCAGGGVRGACGAKSLPALVDNSNNGILGLITSDSGRLQTGTLAPPTIEMQRSKPGLLMNACPLGPSR